MLSRAIISGQSAVEEWSGAGRDCKAPKAVHSLLPAERDASRRRAEGRRRCTERTKKRRNQGTNERYEATKGRARLPCECNALQCGAAARRRLRARRALARLLPLDSTRLDSARLVETRISIVFFLLLTSSSASSSSSPSSGFEFGAHKLSPINHNATQATHKLQVHTLARQAARTPVRQARLLAIAAIGRINKVRALNLD